MFDFENKIGHDRINILGVGISAVTPSTACQLIAQWIEAKKKIFVCVAPVSTIVDCQKSQDYRNLVNQAAMVTPDGMPVVWLRKWRGNKMIQRTYGPDLMLALSEFGQDKGFRHYYYGGSPQVCEALKKNLKKRFAQLHVAGQYSPPFHAEFRRESQEVIDDINRAKPDILWVGLGSPKQDYWMREHRDVIDAPVMIGIGAAFDFLSGHKMQAPRWIQRSGLEWLFRLCCEPKRLWRRYLIGNTQFVYYVIKDFLKMGRQKYEQ